MLLLQACQLREPAPASACQLVGYDRVLSGAMARHDLFALVELAIA